MTYVKYINRFAKLDKIRFWLSCKLYKTPLVASGAFVVAGALATFAGYNIYTDKQSISQQSLHEKQILEISLELSVLQARADRLESLGKKWVDTVGLKDEGFDFGEDLARGGFDNEDTFEIPNNSIIKQDIDNIVHRYDLLSNQLQILDHWQEVDHSLSNGKSYLSPGGRYQTSSFGARYDPFGRGKAFHSGIDFSAKHGDPVMSMAKGKVIFAGSKGGYGKIVEIDHGQGYQSRYAHNSSLLVKAGQQVDAGQKIAKAGSTGRSTGTHLHVEIIEHGRAVDPAPFLERGESAQALQKRILAKLDTNT